MVIGRRLELLLLVGVAGALERLESGAKVGPTGARLAVVRVDGGARLNYVGALNACARLLLDSKLQTTKWSTASRV